MTVRYRYILVPLNEREKYLVEVGMRVPRTSRAVRAKADELSECIPLFTQLDTNRKLEHVFEESCGCRYTMASGTPKVSARCGKGRECKFFVK